VFGEGEHAMLLDNRAKAVLNALLGVLFAMISVGAALGGLSQVWPLVLIFGAIALYSFIKVFSLLRSVARQSG
jgi:hypothetical protein